MVLTPKSNSLLFVSSFFSFPSPSSLSSSSPRSSLSLHWTDRRSNLSFRSNHPTPSHHSTLFQTESLAQTQSSSQTETSTEDDDESSSRVELDFDFDFNSTASCASFNDDYVLDDFSLGFNNQGSSTFSPLFKPRSRATSSNELLFGFGPSVSIDWEEEEDWKRGGGEFEG